MIQSTLFFLLGFLAAGFLALMVAPAVWRRAVTLTRRRIEASVPLTANEIQADKDRMRAEFAMSTRRLEMSVKELRDKVAAQAIELTRSREELKTLASELVERSQLVSDLEAKGSELRAELREREQQIQRLTGRLAEADRLIEKKALELDNIGRLYDEASFSSSSRQIEIVARESEVEKLAGDIAALKQHRKDAERRVQEALAEAKIARDDLKAGKRQLAEVERKLERMLATLADKDEKLERRERELSRLRDQVKGASENREDLAVKLAQALAEKAKLEAEVAQLAQRLPSQAYATDAGEPERTMATLSADRDRQESRLVTLARENSRLKQDLKTYEQAKPESWNDEQRETAALRERMNDLAAEVVNLTAMLEGPDSPIASALASGAADAARPGKPVSLADRVKALQKASAR